MQRSIPLMALTAVALLLSACSGLPAEGGDSAALADADVVIAAEDVAYADVPESVPAGEVTLGLNNRGFAPHDLTIEGLGTVVAADGRDQAIADVRLEPGTYTVWCSVPGHREAGMEFTLEVLSEAP